MRLLYASWNACWFISYAHICVSSAEFTHPDSSDRLRRSHITQYCSGCFKLRVPLMVLRGYTDATVTGATAHAVAAGYPHSTLKGTPTCSSDSHIEPT